MIWSPHGRRTPEPRALPPVLLGLVRLVLVRLVRVVVLRILGVVLERVELLRLLVLGRLVELQRQQQLVVGLVLVVLGQLVELQRQQLVLLRLVVLGQLVERQLGLQLLGELRGVDGGAEQQRASGRRRRGSPGPRQAGGGRAEPAEEVGRHQVAA